MLGWALAFLTAALVASVIVIENPGANGAAALGALALTAFVLFAGALVGALLRGGGGGEDAG
ncbi:MAG: DUF1328 domain-containing protein [Pseudomonadota bacterium]